MDESVYDLTKIKMHSLKRKAPPSERSSLKSQKRFKSDDTASVLSLSTSVAYGARAVSDEFDSDDDESVMTECNRSTEFVQLDQSLLNRDNGVLFSEDLTDDYEVWTLQCPDDVNINELKGKSLNFYDLSTLKIENTLSTKIDIIPYRNVEETNMTVVVPSEITKKLSLNLVPLTGKLILSNRVKKERTASQSLLPIDTLEDAAKRRSQLMSKITQRLSNKYDAEDVHTKQNIKVEAESPKKVKKKSRH